MRESMITTILSGICGVLLIVAVVGICLRDRTAPEISFNGKNTLTYTEGDSYDELLKGMEAVDDVDGDVTDSIRVSNIYATGENKAMVVYVAKDSSNNIAKLKREVRYAEKQPEAELTEETQETSVGNEGAAVSVNAGVAGAVAR